MQNYTSYDSSDTELEKDLEVDSEFGSDSGSETEIVNFLPINQNQEIPEIADHNINLDILEKYRSMIGQVSEKKNINIRQFILENQDVIYNPKMKDHSLNIDVIEQYKSKIRQLPNFEDEKDINMMIDNYKKLCLCIVDNIIYVPFEEYLTTLRYISDDIIQYMNSYPDKDIYFYIEEYQKSNFWVFMLCIAFFIREDIPIKIINKSNRLAELKNSFIIYPDDMSYSGMQISDSINYKFKYESTMQNMRENGNQFILLLSRIGKKAIRTLQIDAYPDVFYISNQMIIIESALDVFEKNGLLQNFNQLSETVNQFTSIIEYVDSREQMYLFLKSYLSYTNDIIRMNRYDNMTQLILQSFQKYMSPDLFNQISKDKLLNKYLLFLTIQKLEKKLFTTNGLIEFSRNADLISEYIKIQNLLEYIVDRDYQFVLIFDLVSKIGIQFKEMERNTLICFQHKMADIVSIPMFLFHNGVYIEFVNDLFEFNHVGSFFNNCPRYDTIEYILETDIEEAKRCPPTYYKTIKYTYNGQNINLQKSNIIFDYYYYDDKDISSDDEQPIPKLRYSSVDRSRIRSILKD